MRERKSQRAKTYHIFPSVPPPPKRAPPSGERVFKHMRLWGDIFHPNDDRKFLRRRGWLEQSLRMASVWEVEKGDSMLGGKTWVEVKKKVWDTRA